MYSKDMAKIDCHLPPHCQVRLRRAYADVYFAVHPKNRPSGWPATINLGRTDRMSVQEIMQKAQEVFHEFEEFRAKAAGVCLNGRAGSLPDIILRYKNGPLWTDLSARTRKDYAFYLEELRQWSGKNNHPNIAHLSPPVVVRYLNGFEDTPVKQARMRSILRILCSVAVMEGFLSRNPIDGNIRLKRRAKKKRPITLWSQNEMDSFIAAAEQAGFGSIGTAALIAFETGQRRGDVLKLQKPRDYKDGRFIFSQNKTGKTVSIRTTAQLCARLDALPDDQLMLVRHENTGRAWQESVFCHKFREIADTAGLKQHIFMHLRHSAVANLERAGNTIPLIASVTGHSRQTVQEILDRHYGVDRDEEMADQAISNLEEYRQRKTGSHTKKVKQSHTNSYDNS